MIIATVTLLTLWLTGGGGFAMEEFRDALKETIADKERRTEIVELTKQVDNEVSDYRDHLKKSSKKAAEMWQNYDATSEEIFGWTKKEEWRRRKVAERVLDARFAAMELMSAAEWEATYDLAIKKASGED